MSSKSKSLLPLTLLIFTVPAFSAMPPAPNYCEHMGYNYTQIENHSQSQGICKFNQNSSCTAEAFMNGNCGQEYIKDLSCRQKGETVFTEFESCCRNMEPHLPPGTSGQPTCQPPKSSLQTISATLNFITQIIGDILLN